MKAALLAAVFQMIAFGQLWAGATPESYAGKAEIPELGTIHFPPGEWRLEFRRVHKAPTANDRDYFVFKKTDGIAERVSIFRYPKSFDEPLYNCIDGIQETGNGVPREERREEDPGGVGNIASLIPRRDAKDFSVSTIYVPLSPERPWLCHALLFRYDGNAFIVSYSSQTVTDPLAVYDICSASELKSWDH
jgi:hypothetical protein